MADHDNDQITMIKALLRMRHENGEPRPTIYANCEDGLAKVTLNAEGEFDLELITPEELFSSLDGAGETVH